MTVSDVVAERVRWYRTNRGWTARELSDRCQDVGAAALTPAVIANIEGGRRAAPGGERRRDITVDEWIVLAYVLSVAPALLIAPLGEELEVTITPERRAPVNEAFWWVVGADPSTDERSLYTDYIAQTTSLHTIRLFRDLREAEIAMLEADAAREGALLARDDRRAQEAVTVLNAACGAYRRGRAAIVNSNLKPPALMPLLNKIAERQGIDLSA